MHRRTFLNILGLGASAPLLSSCATWCRVCDNESLSIQDRQLVIDIHAHIFNVQDLPVDGFLKNVFIAGEPKYEQLIIFIINVFRVAAAPTIQNEKKRLEILLSNNKKNILSVQKLWQKDDEKRINNEIDKVDAQIEALYTQKNIQSFTKQERDFYDFLKENEEYFAEKLVMGSRSWFRKLAELHDTIAVYLNFFYVMMSYRYQNFEQLKKLYPDVDLFVPALVDFDHWLYPQEPGKRNFNLNEQMSIMPMLIKYSEGRIRPYVAYDPLRDVYNGNSRALDDALDAVKNKGAVGIKLYPSMGFRVYNNKELTDADFCKLINTITSVGEKLDARLDILYERCAEIDIPIMAHTARSVENIVCTQQHGGPYVERAHPKHWFPVVKKHPKLRVNLGHFATHVAPSLDNDWYQAIRELLLWEKNGIPSNFYADLSHVEQIKNEKYRSEFMSGLKLFLGTDDERNRLLSKLMYGSDWSMLAKELVYKEYMGCITDLITEAGDVSNKGFLGENAKRFLGLDKINIGSGKRIINDDRFKATWFKKI